MYRLLAWGAVAALITSAGCKAFEDTCKTDPVSCLDDTGTAVPAGPGKPCFSDGECVGELRLACIDGACGFTGELIAGDPCQATLECGEGLYCGLGERGPACAPAGAAQVNERCGATADCARGLVCALDGGFTSHCVAAGTGDFGAACSGHADCLAGLYCQPSGNAEPPVCGAFDATRPLVPTWPGIVCPPDDPGAIAYFEVPRGGAEDHDFFRLPFPNDVRRTAQGLNLSGFPSGGDVLGIGVDLVGAYVAAAETDLRGFATNPVVYFRFSQRYTGASRESVRLFDITPGAAEYGRAQDRGWGTSEGKITRYLCENWLNVRTASGAPLIANHTYAAVLTTGITTRDGASFARAPDLEALLADAAPADPVLQAAHAAYAPLRAFLADPASAGKLAASEILNVAVFTTQDPFATIPALRSEIRALPPPGVKDVTACDVGVTSPCDDGAERACGAATDQYLELHGRISLPIFQAGEAPYLAAGGDIHWVDGKPAVQRSEDVCFGLVLPRSEPPETGYPLVIYAHGTGGSFTSGIHDLAETTSAAGAALLTFDLPQHGSRKNGSERGSDELFYNFLNPRAARDNVAQGSADLFSLVHWALSANEPAGGAFGQAVRFDGARIVLFGHSQGATHASLTLAYESDLLGAVLSGVGGDLSEGLTTKTAPIDLASALPIVLGDPEAAPRSACRTCIGSSHPVHALLQSYFERVDPVNFAAALRQPPADVAPKHVFMTYGLGDTYSPEVTQAAFAVAAGLPQVAPELAPLAEVFPSPLSLNVTIGETAVTQGVRQYQPPAGEDGHFVYRGPAKPDWQRFVTALLQGMPPQIGE